MSRELTRRALLGLSGAAVAVAAARGLPRAGPSVAEPLAPIADLPGPLVLNDASELSPVRVARHVTRTARAAGPELAELRRLLADARRAGTPFAVSAARHSMGGQSLPLDGLALTLAQDWIEPDTASGHYRVASGTRWSRVIDALDPLGFSPAVMQSNNDFGVASTFSVNAHGWAVPFPGCGATVHAIDMLLADGARITCSREENPEVFRAAMGGYGLLGLITELELEMVPNLRLEPAYARMPGPALGAAIAAALAADPTIRMAYGRMNVTREGFFEDAVLICYRPAADQSALEPARGSGAVSHLSRHIFRAQLGSDRIKRARWWTETELAPSLLPGIATRNGLLNEPVATLDDRDPDRTDILHEYFVAPDRFDSFVAACQDLIPGSDQELLNVTLRYVAADSESLLAYAPAPRIAAVMLFSQAKTAAAEADMARLTEALIDRVLSLGGSYYLPYRPHARTDQMRRAYPGVEAFVAAKRSADPGLLFRNRLWDRYLAQV